MIHTGLGQGRLQSSAAKWKSGWSDKYLKQGAILSPLISANGVE